jgi:hypothetical protein
MPAKGSRATKPNRKMAPLRVTAVVPEKRKRGHPTIKTPELLDELCRRIASGRSIISLSHDEDMPEAVTIYRWRQEDSNFNNMLPFAREERKEITRDRLLKLATDVLPVEGLAVDRVNAASHCLSKAEAVMQPRQRIEMTGANGAPIETKNVTMSELARRIAFVFHLAALEKKAGLIEGNDDGGA